MAFLSRLTSLLRNLARRQAMERDLAEEVNSYVDLATQRKIKEGLSGPDARRAAVLELGGTEQVKEQVREARLGFSLDTFGQDLRQAARSLRKKPAFTLAAITALALGIGANAAIFTVVRGVLLKSLPLPEPDRLVSVGEIAPTGSLTAVPYQNYLDWRGAQHVFTEMGARLPFGGILVAGGQPERLFGRCVTASFFPTLRIVPQLGRFFDESEDRMGGERVMVIGDALWRRLFAADASVVGTSVQFNGGSWTIIGVLPRDFDFYGRTNGYNDFFIPLGQLQQQDNSGRGYPVRITARLKDGVSEHDARVEMLTLAKRSALQYPQTDTGNPIDVRLFLTDYVGETKNALMMISAGVVLLLLIACANVANLTLARATTRQREIALRLALGASRRRVIRLLLTESMLLALVGGVAGCFLAYAGVEFFKAMAPDSLPRLAETTVDAWALAATLLVTVGSAILFGLAPALQVTRPNLDATLKEGGRQSSGGAATRKFRNALVVTELALSLTLLIGAGLLVQSFRKLIDVNPGFETRNVLTFRLRLPEMKYPEPAQATGFLKEAQRRLQRLPGVENVALATGFPMGRSSANLYWIEGTPEPKNAAQWPVSVLLAVSESYHQALGIPLLAGRRFNEQDRADSPPVAIVDDELARRAFPGMDLSGVIGRRLRFEGNDEAWREIIGIVGHVRQDGLDENPRPEIYRPWTQLNQRRIGEWLHAMDIILKTNSNPMALVSAIKREVQQIDPDQPLGPVATLESLLDESLAPRRVNVVLLGTFSAVGLLLGVIGLYGVMSYTVSQRTQEIGVRIALGAQEGDVLKLILGEGMLMALAGTALGVAGAFGLTRLMSSLLFGISASDPLTYASISLLIIFVALLASYIPARRAAKLSPMLALRYE
ncbi:MAG: ABC transporter permease [Chthoniobacterales bacterium]